MEAPSSLKQWLVLWMMRAMSLTLQTGRKEQNPIRHINLLRLVLCYFLTCHCGLLVIWCACFAVVVTVRPMMIPVHPTPLLETL